MEDAAKGAPVPADEEARLRLLRETGLLDSPPEREFDDLAGLAAALFDAPIALISLVDRDRQWFKAAVGLPRGDAPRSGVFCSHVVYHRETLVVPDAAKDPRFAANPLVIGEPGIRFYAGAPIALRDGHVLGTLCVVDRRPRFFGERERTLLESLARQVVVQVDLRLANRALSRQEERLELAIRGADLGVWDWNIATGEVSFNERWASMLEYGLDEIEPHVRSWEKLVHPEDLPTIRKALTDHLEGRVPYYRTEHRLKTKSGGWRWVLDSGKVSERDASGRPVRATGTHLDITGEREAQAALLRSEAHLREAQKLEVAGRLAGGVAHDFNNLLTVINGYSELLAKALLDDPRGARMAQEIAKAGSRAAELCGSLLAFSRRQVLNPVEVDLSELLRSMAGMVRRMLGEGIEAEYDLSPTGCVRADRVQMGQVLIHLAVKARAEMPDGGKVSIRTRRLENGSKTGLPAGPAVQLTFQDGGPGVGADGIDAILPGLIPGFGIAAVHGIVSQSGGRLDVHPVPGQGTTYQITLPALTAGVEPARIVPSTSFSGGGERVLLVEDSGSLRILARRILANAGYAVLEAMNAEEAFAVYERVGGSIDLLLTDIVMPGMRGTELAKALHGRRPGLPVLFMSGFPADAVDPAGELEAKGAFIPKPFTPSDLLAKIRSVLGAAALNCR